MSSVSATEGHCNKALSIGNSGRGRGERPVAGQRRVGRRVATPAGTVTIDAMPLVELRAGGQLRFAGGARSDRRRAAGDG